MPDHVQQAWIGPEELLPKIVARFRRIFLPLAVNRLAHPIHEHAVDVAREQIVPLASPNHLDHIPARPAEDGLELLDDLAVSAYRAVEPLQIAVHDEDQIVDFLARSERDGPKRFRFVGFSISEEGPDLTVRSLLEPAIFEIAVKARLINGHDRAESHRHRREFPELRHEPWMRIRGQSTFLSELAPKVFQMLLVEAAFEKRPRIDSR